jgi:hypothetical protein
MQKNPQLYEAGDKEPIRAGALEQTTVKAGTEVTVWSYQVAQDELAFHGHGRPDREYAEAFVGLDLVATGNEAAAAQGDNIDGDVILAITNSDGTRVKASTTFDSLEQLRDALAEARTDRIVEPALAPYAKPGRNLEVRIDAASSSDGYEIDPDGSSGTLYFTQVDR